MSLRSSLTGLLVATAVSACTEPAPDPDPSGRAAEEVGRQDRVNGRPSIPRDVITIAIVVDGLEPDMVAPERMPNLSALIAGQTGNATTFTSATASMVTETLPNHVGMLTGLTPGHHGVVANTAGDGSAMKSPALIRTETFIDAVERQRPELTTAVVVGWMPLVELFDCTRVGGVCAPSRANPEGELIEHLAPDHLVGADTDPASWTRPEENAISEPLAESTHDHFVIDQLIALFDSDAPPDTAFVNLPIVDSVEHLFGAHSAAAVTAMLQADLELGRLVTYLRDTGRWERTVLVITADHSFLDLDDLLVDVPVLGQVSGTRVVLDERLAPFAGSIARIVTHAGSASIYLRDPARTDTAAAIATAARGWRDALGRPAVAGAYCRLPAAGCPALPASWGPFPARLGEVLLVADDQHVLLETQAHLYAGLLGHHGGPTALAIPLVVASGGPFVRQGVVERAVTNRDVAPTLGFLHRIEGTDGAPFPGDTPWSRPLREAFR